MFCSVTHLPKMAPSDTSQSPLLDEHFFPRYRPQTWFLYHLKALVTENSKISPTGSSAESHEIITKHFFFCPSSWKKFSIFFVIVFLYRGVSRLIEYKNAPILAFLNIVWPFTPYGRLETLWRYNVGFSPSFHWNHHALGGILSGHTWCGGEKPDLIASPGRGAVWWKRTKIFFNH